MGGSRGSSPILNEFSTIIGIILLSTGQLISKQGLKLTQISQGLNSRSTIKSNPKISKLHSRLPRSITLKLALITSPIMQRIFATMSRQKLYPRFGQVRSRQRWNSGQDTLLPGQCFQYYQYFFWMASLVRWICSFERSDKSYFYELVRMQPYLYQQAFIMPFTLVIIMQCLISNFLPLYRKGLQIQDCSIQVLVCPLACFYFLRIRSITFEVYANLIPLPLFEFQPGLTIHTFLGQLSYQRRNRLYYGSSGPLTLKVLGMQSKGSAFTYYLQQWNRDLKRFFLEPMLVLRGMWFVIIAQLYFYYWGMKQPSLHIQLQILKHYQ